MMRKRSKAWFLFLVIAIVWNCALAQSEPHGQAFDAYKQADYAEAYRIWEGLANNGDPGAQYALGVMYYQGEGRVRDVSAAMQWFEKAAHSGLPIAMFNLGAAYWEGGNYETAVDWWQKAADLDDAISQFNLGLAYRFGKGVDKDIDRALYWVRKAAEHNYAGATKALSMLEEEYRQLNAGFNGSVVKSGVMGEAAAEKAIAEPAMPAEVSVPMLEPQVIAADLPATAIDGLKAGVIKEDYTPVFAASRTDAPVINTLASGEPVKVVSSLDGWSQIQKSGGLVLWVGAKYVSEKDGVSSINATNVRARPLPSTESTSIPVGLFDKGDPVVVLAHEGGWMRVRAPEKLAGWVRTSRVGLLDAVTDSWREKWSAAANRDE